MPVEKMQEGVLLRVRLTPNSSSCGINGVFVSPEGAAFLKINVVSVPEKGKANQELIKFLAKKLKLAKSAFEIVSGELDRYKKIKISGDADILAAEIEKWGES